MICPECGVRIMQASTTAYLEWGTWLGNEYETEGWVVIYECPLCGFKLANVNDLSFDHICTVCLDRIEKDQKAVPDGERYRHDTCVEEE